VDEALKQFKIDDWKLKTDEPAETLWERVRASRQKLLDERSSYLAAAQAREQDQADCVRVQVLRVAIACSQSVKELQAANASPPITRMEQVNEFIEAWRARGDAREAKLAPFESAFAVRLRTDLQLVLWHDSSFAAKCAEEICTLWKTLDMLAAAEPLVTEMQTRLSQLGYLFSRLHEQRGNQAVLQVIERIREALLDELQKVWGHLSSIPYPFPLPQPVEHLSAGLLSHTADANNPGALYEDVEQFCTGFWSVWRRTLGRLAEIAEDVEATASLPPLSA